MRASGLIILGLASIVEIGSGQIYSDGKTHLRPNYLRYPTNVESAAHDKSHSRDSPKTIEKITDSPSKSHRRRKKIQLRTNSDRWKSLRPGKGSKNARRPHRINSNAWKEPNFRGNKLNYSDLPPAYLEPPKIRENDYNYYANAKKSEDDDVGKKIGRKVVGSLRNHRLKEGGGGKDDNGINYVRDHAPELQVEASDDVGTTDSEESGNADLIGTSETPKDRIEFHIQGHEGPETYIFGYDTGDGNNRQFRLEERHEDGSVTGQYGYIDARGKLRKVRYKATPTEGYVEKHHETNEQQEN